MGKKIPEEMAKERPKFIEGAKATHGIDARKAGEVFDLLEKFANYGFNKSHAAAYAVVSYQTAWLKANHPVEFMAAVMNCDIHLTDKLALYADEVRRGLGIGIVLPCVNRSDATFSVHDGKVVYALGALKNVGVDAMRLIAEARGKRPFVTLFDFARRVDLKRVGKRPLEMLARAGAFDVLDSNRRRVFDSLDALVAYSAAVHDAAASSQVSLFGEAGEDLPEPRLPQVADWMPGDRLTEEHQAIGFYLSGHPLDDYAGALKRKGLLTLAELQRQSERVGAAVGRVGVLVSGVSERKSARGTRFFRMNISDPTGQCAGMALFPEDATAFEACRRVLEASPKVILTLEARSGEGQFDPVARSAAEMEQAIADAGTAGLRVHIEAVEAARSVRDLLDHMVEEGKIRSRAPVSFCILDRDTGGEIEIEAGETFPVNPEVRRAIKAMQGVLMVEEI
jgi:DNA polymerase-3 subunit alpha